MRLKKTKWNLDELILGWERKREDTISINLFFSWQKWERYEELDFYSNMFFDRIEKFDYSQTKFLRNERKQTMMESFSG